MTNSLKQHIDTLQVCLLIPTYNHAQFLGDVIQACKTYPIDIIVVNDGSTDHTIQIIEQFSSEYKELAQQFHFIHFDKNKGKGAALKAGAKYAKKLGYHALISIDSDGQHYPSDMVPIIEKALEHPDAIIIGSRGMEHENMPKKNTFANKFSNFWFNFQTRSNLPDTQSGFRYYPIQCFENTIWFTDRYNFELEIMVRNIWRGRSIFPVPINVYYPPAHIRVSHFRPTVDFLRITLLNTFLSILAIIYFYPKTFLRGLKCR
jgi:glycosyltransferase involved in cell wall biosynthesis